MSPPLQDEDAALMLLAQKDDYDAFNQIVLRHQGPLLNFFLRSGVDSSAEDLVQKTFVRIFRYRKRYRQRAKFTTFLYMIARQVWIDELRARQRQRDLRDRYTEHREIFHQDESPPSSDGLSDELQSALAQLPDAMREVVVLGVIQEMEYADIAEILQIPVGTVKSRMFYALRTLREKIAPQNEHDRER